MSRKLRILQVAITVLTAAVLLVPTTLLYLFGMFLAIASFFQRGKFDIPGLAPAAFLLLPGYGLLSAWWLFFRFWSLSSVRAIPKVILGGLAVGISIAVFYYSLDRKSFLSQLSDPKAFAQSLLGTLNWGGGPFVVAIVLLTFIAIRR